MRRDGEVAGLGQVRDLEPGRDAADARDVDLHDVAGLRAHIVGELADRVERLADRDRQRALRRKLRVALQVVGRQRLLEPADAELGIARRTPQRLAEREALVGIDHQLEAVAHRLAHRAQAFDVVGEQRLADLELGALEAGLLGLERLAHQRIDAQMQPAAFGRIDRDGSLRATRGAPQRLAVAPAAPVPQGGIDRGEREARDRADAGGVGREQQIAPELLDTCRVATDEAPVPMV